MIDLEVMREKFETGTLSNGDIEDLIGEIRQLRTALAPRWIGNDAHGRLMECKACYQTWIELSGGVPFEQNHEEDCALA